MGRFLGELYTERCLQRRKTTLRGIRYMATIIAFANQKGGCGKSTSVFNIAHCLAKYEDKHVLVIDTDPQHNTTLILSPLSPYDLPLTFYHLVSQDAVAMDACIYQSKYPNVDILPSNMELFGWDVRDSKGWVALRDKISDDIRQKYDFILIDCPPNLNAPLNNALSASDYYIIPIKSEDFFALKGMQQLESHISFIKQSFNPGLKRLGVIVTMFDGRTTVGKAMNTAIRTYFRTPENGVFIRDIRNNTAINRANTKQKTIFDDSASEPGAEDYKALTKEILARLEAIHS